MELRRRHRRTTESRTTEEAAKAILAGLGVETESSADDRLGPGIEPDYERFLPPSVYSLRENLERDPEYLRRVFPYVIGKVADAFDSLDHQYGPDPLGSRLQNDCGAVRQLVRSFDVPELPPRDIFEDPTLEQELSAS